MRAIPLVAAALLAAACGPGGDGYGGAPAPAPGPAPAPQASCDPSTAASTAAVTLSGMAFVPSCVKVAAGTTVTFTDQDAGTTHDVAADDGSFASPPLTGPGQAFARAFSAPGTVGIRCTYHAAMGMRGTVIVE